VDGEGSAVDTCCEGPGWHGGERGAVAKAGGCVAAAAVRLLHRPTLGVRSTAERGSLVARVEESLDSHCVACLSPSSLG
jgi:hypothetical protein